MTGLSDLKTKIEKTLLDESVPLWFPDLTKDLAEFGWERLYRERQINPESYSTNRLLFPNSDFPCEIIAVFTKDDESSEVNEIIQLEMLLPQVSGIYTKQGAEFYKKSEILDSSIEDTLREAFSVLRQVPSLNNSVFDLVRALHLIKSDEDGEYDVSFSEPHIPFSIFVSVPRKRVFADFLRVAEAIVHEAMHLQLTLVEHIVPLVITSSEEFYSPWRSEFRNAKGLIHALYVFRSIDDFLRELLKDFRWDSDIVKYIQERKTMIKQQVTGIKSFRSSFDLSLIGKSFARNLFVV
jgi:hypothetical protein